MTKQEPVKLTFDEGADDWLGQQRRREAALGANRTRDAELAQEFRSTGMPVQPRPDEVDADQRHHPLADSVLREAEEEQELRGVGDIPARADLPGTQKPGLFPLLAKLLGRQHRQPGGRGQRGTAEEGSGDMGGNQADPQDQVEATWDAFAQRHGIERNSRAYEVGRQDVLRAQFGTNARIYIHSPDEAPKGAAVKRGKLGGLFYESTGQRQAQREEPPKGGLRGQPEKPGTRTAQQPKLPGARGLDLVEKADASKGLVKTLPGEQQQTQADPERPGKPEEEGGAGGTLDWKSVLQPLTKPVLSVVDGKPAVWVHTPTNEQELVEHLAAKDQQVRADRGDLWTPDRSGEGRVSDLEPHPDHIDTWVLEALKDQDVKDAEMELSQQVPLEADPAHATVLETHRDGSPKKVRWTETALRGMADVARRVIDEQDERNGDSKAFPNERPQVFITMGLTGAGKTEYLIPTIAQEMGGRGVTVIDPDHVKAQHESYNGRNAATLHRWSKTVADQFMQGICLRERRHCVVDGTGQDMERIEATVEKFSQAGYDVHVRMADVPVSASLHKAITRFRRENKQTAAKHGKPMGRYVPLRAIAEKGMRPRNNFRKLLAAAQTGNESRVKSLARVDTNVQYRRPAVLVERWP